MDETAFVRFLGVAAARTGQMLNLAETPLPLTSFAQSIPVSAL